MDVKGTAFLARKVMLIEELGEERYVEALAEHRRSLRATFAAHGGLEVDTQGDAFLYVFPDPEAALEGAAAGQRERWPPGLSNYAWAFTRGRHRSPGRAMPGASCTGQRASPRPGTAARSSSRRDAIARRR